MQTLFIWSEPIAQPRQRHTRFGNNYIPASHPVHSYKRLIAEQCRLSHACMIDGAVSLEIIALFPRPKSMIWKRKPMPRSPYVAKKKNDADNIAKAIMDAMSGILFADDGLVTRLVVERWYASGYEQSHVELTVGTHEMPVELPIF